VRACTPVGSEVEALLVLGNLNRYLFEIIKQVVALFDHALSQQLSKYVMSVEKDQDVS
jgi:hypothetical protein